MLDTSDLEAPHLHLDLAMSCGSTLAGRLVLALAAIPGTLAPQQRVVRVDVPARGAREREIVDGDALDLTLDRDEEGVDVAR